ncbi:N-acyl-D-amino-acid deacylase family protein [Parasphingorhabdus sp.]|uniref:N-acyl-D-amino-acid deacylase family protein n=1 Tax=Parasphingorhabdus sp. TaxID=2709688 RepID=UPI002F957813
MKSKISKTACAVTSSLAFGLLFNTLAAAQVPEPNTSADILITGGTIYPGGADPYVGDIAISDDRIVFVGPRYSGTALRTIEAKGMIVSPGFIDTHTHVGDALSSALPAARLVMPFLTQGVTTAFIGVDGGGETDISAVFGKATGRDYGINFASYVGLGALRKNVIGSEDRAPTKAELTQMVTIVDEAMCQGALGLSTGLFYAPQSYAKEGEVVTLAKVAAKHGGVYDSHIRDESSYTVGLESAVSEALSIGKEAGIPVHIAHIKALGVDVHGKASTIIGAIEKAQSAGQVVHADQYPWSASGTGLDAALLPRWAQDGGRKSTLERFDDPPQMAKIRTEMTDNLRRRGGPTSLLITSGPDDVKGKTLEEIATETGADPVQAAIDLLRRFDLSVASFNQDEADIATFMNRPWVMTSSDASRGHPRYYASYARKYDTYVKDRKVINLRQFIDQSTSVPAKSFSLEGRGTLSKGAFADVVVFDPETYAPRATFVEPTLFSTGVQTVLVNGVLAIDEGMPTGTAAGRPLPRKSGVSGC